MPPPIRKFTDFHAICSALDTIRGAIDVGILGESIANRSSETGGQTALIAPAVTEFCYAGIVSLLLLVELIKSIWKCIQDRDFGKPENINFLTFFRLCTVVMSAIAGWLILSEVTRCSNSQNETTCGARYNADIGIILAAFSIFTSRGVNQFAPNEPENSSPAALPAASSPSV